jgi:hypothetical protein
VPLTERPVAAGVDELVAGATSREVFTHADGKSETLMERVVIDGERYVLKHLDHRRDWIMRCTGDLACRPVTLWRTGLFDRLPDVFDHTVVGASWDGVAGSLLMRDVSDHLVPEGDDVLPMDQHLRFLDHMAQMHAAFWGFRDEVGLTPLDIRYLVFHPEYLCATEVALGSGAAVPTEYVPLGWARFPERAPKAAAIVRRLLDDVRPLVDALRTTPMTFVHADWKAGNLGSHPDGRTILLDWAVPGEAPACAEVTWYVAINRARLPESKDQTIKRYREALERHGVDTGPWWDRQLALSLLGTMTQFGWEKALYDGEEHEEDRAWWERRAVEGADYLSE